MSSDFGAPYTPGFPLLQPSRHGGMALRDASVEEQLQGGDWYYQAGTGGRGAVARTTLCTRMQPISRTALTQCDAPSVPPAHELAESCIIPQVPPPPVIARGKAHAVLGVRRQVLLEQLQRLVAVPEQHPNERLIGDQLALAVDLGVGARSREQMPGAVARTRSRQHGGHQDLG